jgi:hypothetical protein
MSFLAEGRATGELYNKKRETGRSAAGFVAFAVFGGGDAHEFGEHAGKIILVVDPEETGHFLYGHLGEEQVLAGFLDFEVIEVFDGRVSSAFAEGCGEMGYGEFGEVGEFLEGDDGMDLFLHPFDGPGDGIIGFFVPGGVEFVLVEEGGEEVIEDHVDVAEVIGIITLFEIGVDIFEEADAIVVPGEGRFGCAGGLEEESDDIGGEFSFKMNPVNSPWVGLVGAIFMGLSGGDGYILGGGNGDPSAVDLDPSIAFDAIDEDVLADAAGSFGIVEFSLWIVAYIGYIDLACDGIFHENIRGDLFGKDDEFLSFESLSFTQVCLFHIPAVSSMQITETGK